MAASMEPLPGACRGSSDRHGREKHMVIAAGVFRSDERGRQSRTRRSDGQVTGGVQSQSAHVPGCQQERKKQNAVIRLGMRRDMVAPIWEGVTLIPDEITKAANGQIIVTAVLLYAVKILRADGFYKQQLQVQA